MQASVFWITGPWRGRLGMMLRPRGGDWLADDTAGWRKAGLDMLVSLLEPDEAIQLGLDDEAAAATASGIVFRAFPIPDRGVPASKEAVAALTGDILDALEDGKSVAVHCRQGIGRSGLIAAGVLVAGGNELSVALETVADARGFDVPETNEQRAWLEDFATWLSAKTTRLTTEPTVRRDSRPSMSRPPRHAVRR